MSPLDLLVDPYADTLELPTSGDLGPVSGSWEREQILEHLADQYQVVREIGRGGMGVVFLARDIALHRLVAIKVLRYEYASSDEHRERFRREARTTARLSHPNIVPVYTFGEMDGLVFIVMKYVHGHSLAERMRRERRIEPGEVRRILSDLAAALESAQRDGVVHRDLKAENILLEGNTGRAMLTDFGVALLRSMDPVRSESARSFGTPHYMSPEQAAGELDIDGRSDIYSLGVLGYYMLSGRLPFDAGSFEALAAKHITEAPPALAELVPSAPESLVTAIETCLRKEREDRFPSGAELAAALGKASAKPRWLARATHATSTLFRSRLAATAVLAGALRMLARWTTT